MAKTITKYNRVWKDNSSSEEEANLLIEMACIKRGGKWKEGDKECGEGLFFHYRAMQSLLWPKDDHHRWSDLILTSICENDIVSIMGCSDSGKTWSTSKFALCDYWCFPDETLWLISTTEGRGSELRIWGCIKDLFNQARERFDWLKGNPIDYLKTITTDSIDEEKKEARSLRRGLIVVPCKVGSVSSGLAPFIGIKSPRLRHLGDETAVMSQSHLNGYANWFGKEDFKGINAGNFMEYDDPLGVATEPENGWDTFVDSGKTQTWKGKFYGAFVIALDGRDSPNFDFPVQPNGRQKYPYMIGQKKLDGIAKARGTDSWEWHSQCLGKPVKGMDIWRVLQRGFSEKHHALDEVNWEGDRLVLSSLDPAYGGGDRCVFRHFEMGKDTNGKQILYVHPPEIIPIALSSAMTAEEQIASFVKMRLEQLKCEPQNCFYDSFGRGTLGFSFSKLFGANCPVPVDSSMQPTKRPVRFDLFIDDHGKKRLKRCDEHYIKFITEMWFSSVEAIDSEQIRGLDAETIREGCSRKFTRHPGSNKLEVEPKEDMKERMAGRSPDYYDNFCIGIEGARQRGFRIERLGKDIPTNPTKGNEILKRIAAKQSETRKAHELVEV